MKHFFFYCLLVLASCTRPPVAASAQVEQLHPRDSILDAEFVQGPDTPGLHPTPRKRGFLGLFGRKQRTETTQAVSYPLPRKVKGNLTIIHNYVQGNQTNHSQQLDKNARLLGEGATNIDKAKGPTATGSGSATDQTNAGIASTIDGNNNNPGFTNTEATKRSAWQEFLHNLTSPLGIGICVLVVVVVLARVAPWLITQGGRSVAAWKRNKLTDKEDSV